MSVSPSTSDSSIVQWALDDVKPMLLATNIAVLLETLLYGIHFVLFCNCMFILNRNKGSIHWTILASAILMFAISTADITLTFRMMGRYVMPGPDLANEFPYLLRLFYPKGLLFVANNFIAEIVLLYRCYMVWNRSKFLLLGAGMLVIGDTVWGFLGMSQSLLMPESKFVPIFMWSVFALNIVISGITAGRIFLVSRAARPILGDCAIRRRYRTTVAVLLESSAVYSACLFCYLVSPLRSPTQIVTIYLCIRVVAIMPTLLIVQVGLDRIVTNPTSRNRERPASVVLDTIATKHGEEPESSNSGCRHEDSMESQMKEGLGEAV